MAQRVGEQLRNDQLNCFCPLRIIQGFTGGPSQNSYLRWISFHPRIKDQPGPGFLRHTVTVPPGDELNARPPSCRSNVKDQVAVRCHSSGSEREDRVAKIAAPGSVEGDPLYRLRTTSPSESTGCSRRVRPTTSNASLTLGLAPTT